MNRKDFLVGASGMIVAGSALALLLDACKKTADTSASGPALDFTIDLNDPAFAALKNAGGYVYKYSVIIARDGAGYIAIYSLCTHQGCAVQFDGSSSFPCPCHGARFDKNGTVTNGPAAQNLRKYNTGVSGNLLRVYS